MKKLLFILFIGMTNGILYSQVPSYVPTNGLLGYWSFNGSANDNSGNGNDGVVNGATLTTDRFGNANSAYNFVKANNNYITMNNTIGNFGTSDFTISVWFLSTDAISSHIINKRYSQSWGNYWELSKFLFGINDTNNNSNYNVINNTQAQTQNTWYNIIVTRSGTSMKYYINGLLYQTVITTVINNISNTSDLVIGSVITPLTGVLQSHDGKIDDIGMWNRAITQQEITAMYNGINYSDTCNAVSGSLINGLVAYYPFCGNANDHSGNSNNGVVNGATLTTDRFGSVNSAYSFNGTSNFIKVLDNDSLDLTQNLTLSAWIQGNSSTNEQGIIGKGKTVSSTGYALLHNVLNPIKTGISIQNIPTPAYESFINTSQLNTLNWYHLVGTYNGTELKLYLNGILVNTIATNLQLMPNSLTDLLIGCELNKYRFFNGKIDDVGIWNRAISQQEITQLYSQNQCITNITVTDTLIINVGQLSYTSPVTFANNITIYPNPASTQVNISFNNITDLAGGSIKIINSLGQQVAITPITLSGTNTTLALNTWGGTGLYFVQIINAQGQIVDIKKIILQ